MSKPRTARLERIRSTMLGSSSTTRTRVRGFALSGAGGGGVHRASTASTAASASAASVSSRHRRRRATARGPACSIGRRIAKHVPCGAGSSVMLPLCASTIQRALVRPRPAPAVALRLVRTHHSAAAAIAPRRPPAPSSDRHATSSLLWVRLDRARVYLRGCGGTRSSSGNSRRPARRRVVVGPDNLAARCAQSLYDDARRHLAPAANRSRPRAPAVSSHQSTEQARSVEDSMVEKSSGSSYRRQSRADSLRAMRIRRLLRSSSLAGPQVTSVCGVSGFEGVAVGRGSARRARSSWLIASRKPRWSSCERRSAEASSRALSASGRSYASRSRRVGRVFEQRGGVFGRRQGAPVREQRGRSGRRRKRRGEIGAATGTASDAGVAVASRRRELRGRPLLDQRRRRPGAVIPVASIDGPHQRRRWPPPAGDSQRGPPRPASPGTARCSTTASPFAERHRPGERFEHALDHVSAAHGCAAVGSLSSRSRSIALAV